MSRQNALLATLIIGSTALHSAHSLASCPSSEPAPYKPFRPQVVTAIPSVVIQRNLLHDTTPVIVDENTGPYDIRIDLNQRFSKVESASLKLVFTDDILSPDANQDYEQLTFGNIHDDCISLSIPVRVPYEKDGQIITYHQEYTLMNDLLSADLMDGKFDISLQVDGSVNISEIHLEVQGKPWVDIESMFAYDSSVTIQGINLGEASKPPYTVPLIEISRVLNGPTEVAVSSHIENRGDREREFRQWGILSYLQRDQVLPPLEITGFAPTNTHIGEQTLMDFSHAITFETDYPNGSYTYYHYIQQIDSGEVKVYIGGLNLGY